MQKSEGCALFAKTIRKTGRHATKITGGVCSEAQCKGKKECTKKYKKKMQYTR